MKSKKEHKEYTIRLYKKMSSNNRTNAIMDGMNIDTSRFSYSQPKLHPSGGKVVNLYDTMSKESLALACPLMLTWGAQEGTDSQKNPTGKYTMSLQFPNDEYPNPDASAFLQSLQMLEAKIQEAALKNSKEWFGKVISSSEVIAEKFNPMLRYPKMERGSAEFNYNKPPTLSVKLPCWSGVWQVEVFDEEGVPLFLKKDNGMKSPLDYLSSKTNVICLIQCGGLWFVNGKVAITWNLKQVMVKKPQQSSIVEGTCFLAPRETEKHILKNTPSAPVPTDPYLSAQIYDHDDEEELVASFVQKEEIVEEKVVDKVAVEEKVEEEKVEEAKVVEEKVEDEKTLDVEEKKVVKKIVKKVIAKK